MQKKDENKLKYVKKKNPRDWEKVLEIKNKIVSLQQNMAKHWKHDNALSFFF